MRPWPGPGGASISVGSKGMRMGFDQYAFGKRFKELRKNGKLTQEQLADRLGITDRHIRGIERGDFFPSIDLYALIAESFEISLDMLILGAQPSAKAASRAGAYCSAAEGKHRTGDLHPVYDQK